MKRVQVISSGWSGAPGVNTFYFNGQPPGLPTYQECYDRVQALFNSLKGVISKSVTIHVVPEIDELAESNGDVTATQVVTPAADLTGTSLTLGLAPPGLALLGQYKSAAFISGRRVQGHAFISPCGPYQLESDGTPSAEAIATVHDSMEALRVKNNATAAWVVWSRPRPADSGVKKNLPQRDGSMHEVTFVSCPNKWSQIRSRRD